MSSTTGKSVICWLVIHSQSIALACWLLQASVLGLLSGCMSHLAVQRGTAFRRFNKCMADCIPALRVLLHGGFVLAEH